MKKDLNYFLFKKKVIINGEKEKKAFFRFQSNLADAIVESPGYYYKSKPENIRPYINQVLKSGDAAYEKPMSENLKKQILKILTERLSKKDPLYPFLKVEFEKAYDLLKGNTVKDTNYGLEDDFQEFSKWGIKANRTVTFMDNPAEMYWTANRGKRTDIDYVLNNFFRLMFKNFKGTEKEIISDCINGALKINENIDDSNLFSFQFYVPSFSVGLQIWQKLFRFFVDEKLKSYVDDDEARLKIASNFFKKINYDIKTSKEFNLVNITKVDSYLTTIPLIYFQSHNGIVMSNQNKLFEEVFILNVNNTTIKKIIKISPESLKSWKEAVYYHLISKSKNNNFNKKDIKFSHYEFDIVNFV